MKIAIVTNSFKRELSLVERSLRHSLVHEEVIQKLYFVDQNEPPLQLDGQITDHPKIEVINYKTNCVSTARNHIKIPEEIDWIIFCDDDGYIDINYFEEFKKYIANNPELKIVAGSIIRDDNFKAYSPRHDIGGSLKNFRHTKLLMGSNFAVQRSTFYSLGGFDEMFGAGSYWGSGEETDFCWKAYFANIPMEFNYNLKVFHIRPYAGTFKHSFNKAYRYGIGKGALVYKWLIQKKKPIVLFELTEMILVPLAQAVVNLIKLNPKGSLLNISSIYGRIYGMGMACLNSFSKKSFKR